MNMDRKGRWLVSRREREESDVHPRRYGGVTTAGWSAILPGIAGEVLRPVYSSLSKCEDRRERCTVSTVDAVATLL